MKKFPKEKDSNNGSPIIRKSFGEFGQMVLSILTLFRNHRSCRLKYLWTISATTTTQTIITIPTVSENAWVRAFSPNMMQMHHNTNKPSFLIIIRQFTNYCLTLSFIFYIVVRSVSSVISSFISTDNNCAISRSVVRLGRAVAYISIDRTETSSQLLCKPCLAYPFVL